jgi:hypothetical protein
MGISTNITKMLKMHHLGVFTIECVTYTKLILECHSLNHLRVRSHKRF